MKRRDFLTLSGLALGSILIPSPVARLIRETCVERAEPLLMAPRAVRRTLYAVDEAGGYTLNWGDPYADAKPPSWEEYLDSKGVDTCDPDSIKEYFREQFCCDPGEEPEVTISDPIEGYAYENWLEWEYELQESPTAAAYRYLDGLPICPDRADRSDALGSLSFIEGDRPGSNLTYAQAPDLSTLACLQHRLNELNEGTAVEIYKN